MDETGEEMVEEEMIEYPRKKNRVSSTLHGQEARDVLKHEDTMQKRLKKRNVADPFSDEESEKEEDKTERERFLPDHLMKLRKHGKLNRREKKVYKYFRVRHLNRFFQFMISHLLVHEPDDPTSYLRGLLDQCLLFRSGHMEIAPLLFEDNHIRSIFKSFDPAGTGTISKDQYMAAVVTMGLSDLKEHAETPEFMTENEFLSSARFALIENLLDMIVVPQIAANEAEEDSYLIYSAKKDQVETYREAAEQYLGYLKEQREDKQKLVNKMAVASALKDKKLDANDEEFAEEFSEGYSFQPLEKLKDAYKTTSEYPFDE